MDLLVSGAGRKTFFRFPRDFSSLERFFFSQRFSPVNIQGWGGVEGELLFAGSRGRVPDDGRPVHTRAEDVVPGLIPFQSKYRPFVLAQSLLLLSIGVPDSGIRIINLRHFNF